MKDLSLPALPSLGLLPLPQAGVLVVVVEDLKLCRQLGGKGFWVLEGSGPLWGAQSLVHLPRGAGGDCEDVGESGGGVLLRRTRELLLT